MMALPCEGGLSQIFFEGSAAALVRLLAVPVRPQNPSAIPIASSAAQMATGDSLQKAQQGNQKNRQADSEALVGAPEHKQRKTRDWTKTLTLSNLPPEIHHLIFDDLGYIVDTICFGLTSRYFWTFAEKLVFDYYASFLGRWAGKNIVCVGEDVEPGDYPPGLFSASELGELVMILDQPLNLYHMALPGSCDMETENNIRYESSRIYLGCYSRIKHFHRAFFEACPVIVVSDESRYFPKHLPWILRNLTTKEFVRSEAIPPPEPGSSPKESVLGCDGFGKIVMSRILWSTSPSTALNDRSNVLRGVWAGHCFDITTMTRHEEETGGEAWMDVTDEVAKEIAEVWSGFSRSRVDELAYRDATTAQSIV